MQTPAQAERSTRRRHTALVLVSSVDRRILPALRFVARLPGTEARAVHVSFDAGETRRLAEDWMRLDLTWLPLAIHDAGDEDDSTCFRRVVGDEAQGAGDVTVVVPELDLDQWWQRVLHRGSAHRIARHLRDLAGVTTVIVPYAVSV